MILQSAFVRSIYAEASPDELACESEVTEPMLYKHFGSESATHFRDTQHERISHRAERDVLEALEHINADFGKMAL